MINNCFQKTKKSFLKRLWKGTETFLKKKKRSDNMADTKNF